MIKLNYVTPLSLVDLECRGIVGIACQRSKKWRKFIKSNPMAESKWFNEIVDWLIKNYPEEFRLESK